MLPDELADLFVDRDGFEGEALRRVVLADTVVRRDRFRISLQPRLEITDLEKRTSVVRVVLNDPLVLRDRPVVPLFLDVLLGSLEGFLAIDLLHVGFSPARSFRLTPAETAPRS